MVEFIYLALIALTAGLVKGLTGFGSSLVALPFLLMLYKGEDFMIITAILITSNVFLNFLLMFENKAFSLTSLKSVAGISVAGFWFTFLGIWLIPHLDDEMINTIAASLIFFALVVKTYHMFVIHPIKLRENIVLQLFVGAVSGVGNGFASVEGPPVVFYLSGIGAEKKQFKNTMVTHSLIMGTIGVFILLFNGVYTSAILLKIICFASCALVGVLGGMLVSKRINERTFQICILIVLLILDIKMIFF